MSEEKTRGETRRQRRVRRLKKGILLTAALLVSTPVLLCILLAVRIRALSGSIAALTQNVELLTQEMARQQALLQGLMEETKTVGQGRQEENASGRGLSGEGLPGQAVRTQEFSETQKTAHKVYLTFDDGPSVYTEKILDILDEYGVKATFFVVGKESETDRQALRQIVERGHTLGMHSYSHRYAQIYASVEDFAEDFVKIRSYLEEAAGVVCDVYRFPGGSSNTVSSVDMRELAAYLDSWDVRFFDWNVSSGDAAKRLLTAEELTKNCLQGIEERETSVILMHDAAGRPTTVEALPAVIESILAMEDTALLPITEDTAPVQHIQWENAE